MNRLIIIIFLMAMVSCTPETKTEEKVDVPKEKIEIATGNEKEVVTFVYHRFNDDRYPTTNISIQDFEAHLIWLSTHNFQVLSLSDAIAYLKKDSANKNTAVITIDDGYKSFYKHALPLLVKYKMPATLFINTETVGAGDYMGWQELKKAMNSKIEIGNHSHSHAYFLNQKQNERYSAFLEDIQLSQKIIEENLSVKPLVFAYPYGEFDDGFETIVKATGFVGAAVQNSGVINGSTNLFQLPRFPMSEAYADKFEEKVLMRSFDIIRKAPGWPMFPRGKSMPILTVTINSKGIVTDQLQCFVQGSECNFKIIDSTPTEITVRLQATASINDRRRTLYTLTAPDSSGRWHWFSHLWINPSVK